MKPIRLISGRYRDCQAILLVVIFIFPTLNALSQDAKFDYLEQVIVRPTEIRPRMKGDTVEYNTSAIKLRPNALVEEMLGRLPGLQVDPNGTITYNGQRIQRLLVDGEDLFGSDPTLVTRGFDASMVAKVQVLDKKSEQAAFTGIDDGSRIKTLNLVLKEDSKNGYFGKVEAGGDPQNYYNTNGLLASFKGREQFTALGMASNIGVLGFSGNTGNGDVQLSVLQWNQDPLGTSAGTGIPRFAAAGLHYANTWDGQENHVSGNYQFGHVFTQPRTTTQTIQALPDTVYAQDQRSNSVNSQDQHYLNLLYDYAPDKLSAFKFVLTGIHTQGQNQFNADGNSNFNGTPVNSSQRSIQSELDHSNWNGGVFWRKQARRKADRVFSVSAGWSQNDNTTNGYLYSLNRFYQPDGSLQRIDTTDQRKQIASHTFCLNGGVNFAEPLWKGAVLGLSYRASHADNHSLQATFNRENDKYDEYVDSLSSQYHGQTLNQVATINLQGKGEHYYYTLGGDLSEYAYHQQDLLTDSVLHYRYLNFSPRAIINYTRDPATNLSLQYIGTTQQPSLTQLQPITNNSDPLHITLGNPNLRPGFNQNLTLDLRRMKSWITDLNLNLGLTGNSISSRTTTDSLGRQTSTPVNTNGGRSAGLNFTINKRIGGIDAGFHSSIGYSRTVNYVNTDLSRNDSYTGGGGFSLGQYVADQYSLQFSTQFAWIDTRSSVNTAAPVRYWTQSHSGSVTLFFIRGFEINTNAAYTWQQATSAFAGNTSVLLWNAAVSRNFLANRLVLRVQANNLLNENAGINRSNASNVNTETSTNILGRYWMLSLTYHFDHQWKRKEGPATATRH